MWDVEISRIGEKFFPSFALKTFTMLDSNAYIRARDKINILLIHKRKRTELFLFDIIINLYQGKFYLFLSVSFSPCVLI